MYLNKYNITKLSSGVHIVSENLPYVRSFSLGFWMNVGSRDESLKNNGISHFLEHMFFKGTAKRSAKRISDDIESLGGYLNAFTSKEQTCFYARGLSNHLEKTFEVLADMLQNSSFDKKEVRKEGRVIIDELRDIEDSPEELIFDKFEGAIYNKSSLGLPIIGSEKNLVDCTKEDLIRFINNKYADNKLFIVASGAVDHQELIKICEKYLYRSFGKKRKRSIGKFTDQTVNMFVPKEINQSHLIIGRDTYGYNSSRRIGVSLLSHILGEGSSSRLFYRVREKNGIAYQINSFLNSFYDISSFGVYLSTNENSILKAKDLIFKEFRKLKEKVISDKELRKSKEFLKGNILMSLENTTNRMTRLAQSFIYFNEIKPIEKTISEINSITSKDLIEFANEIFIEEKLSVILLNSKNLFDGKTLKS